MESDNSVVKAWEGGGSREKGIKGEIGNVSNTFNKGKKLSK